MKKIFLLILSLPLMMLTSYSQSNIILSNPEAQQVLFGNYDPAGYTPSVIINVSDSILHGIVNGVSTDTAEMAAEDRFIP
jgi:hypothetical protein